MEPPEDSDDNEFDLETFLPFILNQTAEITGKAFQSIYREAYGMSRTQWRVIAIIGRYNKMTAKEICTISQEEKSRISRAVAALERDELLARQKSLTDKREELLYLTRKGISLYGELGKSALEFNQKLSNALGSDGEKALLQLLKTLKKAAMR